MNRSNRILKVLLENQKPKTYIDDSFYKKGLIKPFPDLIK